MKKLLTLVSSLFFKYKQTIILLLGMFFLVFATFLKFGLVGGLYAIGAILVIIALIIDRNQALKGGER